MNPQLRAYTGRKGNPSNYLPSIPHRFNSHLKIFTLILPLFNPFQSLTGSIHTEYRHIAYIKYQYSFNPSQVQFTPVKDLVALGVLPPFQSLTGSIHTRQDYKNRKDMGGVSIPHRFNSHRTFKKFYLLGTTVSIPHRFNSHWLNLFSTGFEIKFQSLTGSIHTGRFFINGLKRKSFNPSQVQFTQMKLLISSPRLYSFNPSQVQFTPSFNGC